METKRNVVAVVFATLAVAVSGCTNSTPPAGSGRETQESLTTNEPADPSDQSGNSIEQVDAAEAAEADTLAVPETYVVLTTTDEEVFTLPAAATEGEKLDIEELKTFLEDENNHEPFLPKQPLGLHVEDLSKYIPEDNPLTKAKVELGRQLYFDNRLSRDSTVSCATCHDPAAGWAQNTAVAAGINGQKGGRNSPTILNRLLGKTQFWDGRAATLEEQALGPIQNPIEMGYTLDEVIEQLKGIEGYRLQFERIFGEVSADAIAKAIASFERVVLVGNSPYDYAENAKRFEQLSDEDLQDDPELAQLANEARAAAAAHPLSESARRGWVLFFNKAQCSTCHVGANLSDEMFYNLGIGVDGESPDAGRNQVTKKAEDTGAFKTPTVRNVVDNAPYMHDGSLDTLMAVVEHYQKGGTPNPHLSTKRVKKLNLSDQDKLDLVEFMNQGLTGMLPDIKVPRLP